MKNYFYYLLIYSIGGFFLERIINFIAFIDHYDNYNNILDYIISHDNSVMFGPYQPLYGVGVVLAVFIWDRYLINDSNVIRKNALLLITAIITTGLSEAFHGYGYEILTGRILWDYRMFFPCSIPYVCIYPTTFFGVASYFVIKYIHPMVKQVVSMLPTYLFYILLTVFSLDLIITLVFELIG